MEYLKNTLIYKIRGVRKKLLKASEESLLESGLTLEQYVALHFIYENQGLSQKELADLIWNDVNVVLRMIDKLESMDLVHRQRRAHDRRSYSLFVTQKGEEICHTYWEKLIAYQETCLEGLSAKERQDFKHFLDSVLDE